MIKISKLDSGLIVASDFMSDTLSVALSCFVKIGSRDEDPEIAGSSHFLEHMIFKGTESLSAKDVAIKLDSVGGESNAFTNRESTAFYIRLLADKFDFGLDLLLDLLSRPAFRESDLETERKVMLEEILFHLDEPSDVVFQKFFEALFPGHALGRDIQGSAETISSISREQIYGFWDTWYQSSNMIIVGAGKLEHDYLVEKVNHLTDTRKGTKVPVRETPQEAVTTISLTEKPTEQVHIVIGRRSLSAKDERRYVMSVLNTAIGGGMSSRLFQKVREERGLVYSIGSEWLALTDAGAFGIYASCGVPNVNEVIDVVRSELAEIGRNGISPDELELAKSSAKSSVILSSEGTSSRMIRLGSALSALREPKELEEIVKEIESVSLDDVASLAAEVAGQEEVLAVVGPKEALSLINE